MGHNGVVNKQHDLHPLRFPGQYYDPETGLHYNYFRHYDPETARYLASDPLGLTPAPNSATYVDNPHTWADPWGSLPVLQNRRLSRPARSSPQSPLNRTRCWMSGRISWARGLIRTYIRALDYRIRIASSPPTAGAAFDLVRTR
ncbi:RHS repeat-associated core domain-containing protein [Streptomyces nogalater]